MNSIPFEFQQVTPVHLTNVNSRREKHGDENVPAMDLSMRLEGSNELLNLLDDRLRVALYFNAAATDGQMAMPEVLAVLPNLRHAILHKREFKFAKGVRAKGYRLMLDYGLGGDSNVDLADVTVTGWEFECMEGGSVVLRWSVQCAGEQLTSDVRGMLTGLIDETVHIQLIPPATPQIVQGKDRPAAPPAADAGQGNLLDGDGGDGQGDGDPDPDEDPDDEDTPEKALQRAAGG